MTVRAAWMLPVLVLTAVACDTGSPANMDTDTGTDGDADGDGDTDTDTDADTDADADADTDTGTVADPECTEDADCEDPSPICNESWGICVAASCDGQPDFTPCEVVTAPDRSFDICIDGVCRSPGCGTVDCNAPGPHFPLADTGIRKCYSDDAEIECPLPGEPFFGQDAQYGWDATHDADERFDRDLTVPGQPVVLDNVTGLVWQGCAKGLSGDDCGDGAASSVLTWAAALSYCDGLTWGGRADWRLPDQYEMQSIVDYGRYPAIDDSFFPETPNYEFWSSATHGYMGSPAGSAWVADFSEGFLYNKDKFQTDPEDDEYHYVTARCVRTGPLQARVLAASVPDGDRVVEDDLNGLMWQGCARGLSGADCGIGVAIASTWAEALAYCEGLSWAGYDDWRLPSPKELTSIADSRFASPSVDSGVFPSMPSQVFWSSSSRWGYWVGRALHVDTVWGGVYYYVKTGTYFTFCVREVI